jgi:CRP-like cAMP-binding protein
VHGGEVLFSTGEEADSGFVIQEGSFSLSTGAVGAAPLVIGPGALVGELALMTETKRPATMTALEPSTVLRIQRSLFLKMLDGFPDAAAKLRDILLTRSNQATADIYGVRGALDS